MISRVIKNILLYAVLAPVVVLFLVAFGKLIGVQLAWSNIIFLVISGFIFTLYLTVCNEFKFDESKFKIVLKYAGLMIIFPCAMLLHDYYFDKPGAALNDVKSKKVRIENNQEDSANNNNR